MAEELKACPFCGGEPSLTHSDYVHDDLRPMPVVECKSCSAWVRAEDWNARAQLPSQGGEAVEVVGYQWLDTPRYGKKIPAFAKNQPKRDEFRPLMTVAQHQRILAAATHPADQVADGVAVPRGLLERIIKRGMRLPDETQHQHLEELRALLNGGRS